MGGKIHQTFRLETRHLTLGQLLGRNCDSVLYLKVDFAKNKSLKQECCLKIKKIIEILCTCCFFTTQSLLSKAKFFASETVLLIWAKYWSVIFEIYIVDSWKMYIIYLFIYDSFFLPFFLFLSVSFLPFFLLQSFFLSFHISYFFLPLISLSSVLFFLI